MFSPHPSSALEYWFFKVNSGPMALLVDWIKPDIFPAGLLRMTDLSLVSAPLATFTGWIVCGGRKITVQNAPGLISHYWGRQLSSQWWWVSANQFDKPDVAVECTVLRSSLWDTSLQLPLAYLYLRQQDRKQLIMAPLGLAMVKGSQANFEIEIRRIGAESVTLTAEGRAYGDLNSCSVETWGFEAA